MIVAIIVIATQVEIYYSIRAQGVFGTPQEYRLSRTLEGNLVATMKNNVDNRIYQYDVTEFQRGDVVAFRLNPEIANRSHVGVGDTLGFIVSNEEQRNLIKLRGDLEILRAELEFFTTGQKPEDVLLAQEQWDLAKQDLETQRKLMARTEVLIQDGVISEQEYEIEENKLRLKELSEKIAEANYLSVTTGEKPEQELLIRTKIEALSWQIAQIEDRVSYFNITSPIAGRLYFPRSSSAEGKILSIRDTTSTIALVPIQLFEFAYVKEGDRAIYQDEEGAIVNLDEEVKYLDSRQAIYATAQWPYNARMKHGTMIETTLKCDRVSIWDYFMRRFRLGKTRVA